MADPRDILADDEGQLNDDELLNYLQDNLSEDDKQAFEEKIAESGFENDAIEGLKAFKNKQQLNDYVNLLNKNLEKQLNAKKQLREKRKIKDIPWILLAAILILFLCVLSYVVIHLYNIHVSKKLVPATNIHTSTS